MPKLSRWFLKIKKQPPFNDAPIVNNIIGWWHSRNCYRVWRYLSYFDARQGVHERSSWQLGPDWQHNHIDRYLRTLDAWDNNSKKH